MSSFLLAAVDSERTCNSSQCRRFPFYNATSHLNLLDMVALAIPNIIAPFELSIPTPWHADISHSNRFVAETGPANVQGLIDWQHSIIAPYCTQATFPPIFTYDGGVIDIPTGRVPPKLPPTLSPDEQAAYQLHLKPAMRHKVYEQKIVTENEGRMIVSCRLAQSWLFLPYRILRSWSDSVVPLRSALLCLRDLWETFAHEGTQCPIHFTDEEVRRHEQESQRYTKYQESQRSTKHQESQRHTKYQESQRYRRDIPNTRNRRDIPNTRNPLLLWMRILLVEVTDRRQTNEEFLRAMTKLKDRKANWYDEVNGSPFPYQDGSFSFSLS